MWKIALMLSLAVACNSDKNGDDGDDTGNSGDDTGGGGGDGGGNGGGGGGGDWVPADIIAGTYAMRIVGVTTHTCDGEFDAGMVENVQVVPNGDYVAIWGFANLEQETEGPGLRAQGSITATVPTTTCELTDVVAGTGTKTNPSEFTLDLTRERSGSGDCSSVPSIPCEQAWSGSFRRLEDPTDDTGVPPT